MTGINDPTTGTLTTAAQSLQTELTNVGSEITTDQDRVNQLQTNLTNQMDKADAAISSMEQQLTLCDQHVQRDAEQNNNNNG